MSKKLSAKRPYLLRAYYDWISDNDLTPYLVVDANYYGTEVPEEYVQDGQIILNISMQATGDLLINDDAVSFNARFQGVTRHVHVPMGAAVAIYARENGEGVMFEPEDIYAELNREPENQPQSFEEAVDKPKAKKAKDNSFLRIVK
ncbi:ClpXP protease specificity-enhancing factor [Actinobacillus delphinicola]|uniref:ClpXP protease specificity-enhancing factor n=1 Tax=Actinobacillus delphinicola TaxID=51161 RepID=UPI002442D110|nr:ClpXP protease specificity-enhancing factor [Actinobacillus delphinicola]MDG6898001.1 ClpXP protease specificity-enhancing factor [Actinobacillus delphinicola]